MQHYQTLQQANSYITAPDGTRRYSRYEVGVIDGRYRAMPVLIADKAGFDGLGFDASVGSGDDHYTVLNLFDGSHKYIDSVAVVGADDDDHAAHLALSQFDYLGADYATVVVNDSAQFDDMSLDFAPQNGWSSETIARLMNNPSQDTGYYLPIINSKMLRAEQNRVTADNVMWDGANLVSHGSDYSRLLLDLQKHDAFGGLTAKLDMRELLADLGATELGFDALMETYSRLDAMGDRLFTALGHHAVGDLTVTNVTTTKPFKRQGVANVAMQFDLSDGQTFSIIFHNPDADPKKLAANDTMVSWKWLLNKKDVTAAVSPKQSDKVRYDVIASRIMKVAAKNSKRFVAAQMKKAQNQEKIATAQKLVDDKMATIAQLDADIADLKQQIDDFRLSDEAVAVSGDGYFSDHDRQEIWDFINQFITNPNFHDTLPKKAFKLLTLTQDLKQQLVAYLPNYHMGLDCVYITADAMQHIFASRGEAMAREMLGKLLNENILPDEILPNHQEHSRALALFNDFRPRSRQSKDAMMALGLSVQDNTVVVYNFMPVKKGTIQKAKAYAEKLALEGRQPDISGIPHLHLQEKNKAFNLAHVAGENFHRSEQAINIITDSPEKMQPIIPDGQGVAVSEASQAASTPTELTSEWGSGSVKIYPQYQSQYKALSHAWGYDGDFAKIDTENRIEIAKIINGVMQGDLSISRELRQNTRFAATIKQLSLPKIPNTYQGSVDWVSNNIDEFKDKLSNYEYFNRVAASGNKTTNSQPLTVSIEGTLDSVTVEWTEASQGDSLEGRDFYSLDDLQRELQALYDYDESKLPKNGYDKTRITLNYTEAGGEPKSESIRVDIGSAIGNFNPFKETLADYLKKTLIDMGIDANGLQDGSVLNMGGGKRYTSDASNQASLLQQAIMPRHADSVSEAQALIKPLVGKSFINQKFAMEATISGNTIGKLGSKKATEQSATPRLHAQAVANIDILFERAIIKVTHDDKKNRINVEHVHRLGSIMLDESTGAYVPVMITVIEYKHSNEGTRIYSVEAVEIEEKEKPAGQLVSDEQAQVLKTPIADFKNKIAKVLDEVKQWEAKTPLSNRTLTAEPKPNTQPHPAYTADDIAFLNDIVSGKTDPLDGVDYDRLEAIGEKDENDPLLAQALAIISAALDKATS
ncbi:LPD25 domain-containing protein [Moraxella atlantae]|uniref:Defence against restriction A N-terminal domain-containing protein n=1 Tax=Faucicola atlantae TaxID=34059 RepID=A0A378Q4T4_9GAMM|nr:LPD25 domain-containing protein [Moraxella atlantae]OPH34932.1 hypothetical protein B5J92_06285 [Moraxella atlantae]STY95208.1 Uncharacterised protein [Moraxella atlantae]